MMHVEIIVNICIEADGILKRDPSKCLLSLSAWKMMKLIWMAMGIDKIKPLSHSGTSLIRLFRSSTAQLYIVLSLSLVYLPMLHYSRTCRNLKEPLCSHLLSDHDDSLHFLVREPSSFS